MIRLFNLNLGLYYKFYWIRVMYIGKLKLMRIVQDIDYSALGFALLLFRIVFVYFCASLSMIGGSVHTIILLFYLLIWFLFARGIIKNGVHVSNDGIMFFVCVLFLGVLSMPFSNSQYIWDVSLESFITFRCTSFFHAALYIPLIFTINDLSKLQKYLLIFARVFMLFVVINDFITISILDVKNDDDMMYSYGVVLLTCTLIHNFSKRKNILDILLALVGVFSVFLSGTRGPLVCIAVCLCLSYISRITNKVSKILFIILLGLFVLMGGLTNIMSAMSFFFRKLGFNDIRLVQYHQDNMLMDSSGRDLIASKVWNAIVENGIIGGGIGYDRVILDTYAHNILLECYCNFGLLLGSVLIILIIVACYKFINSKEKDIASLGIILISTILIKLLFSSSYLITFEFFLMLGLYFNNKKKSVLLKK